MITKEQYLESLSKELSIIKHLAEKIKPEQLAHKPTEPQRTLQELMHYLGYIFVVGAEMVITGDKNSYEKHSKGEMPTVENFGDIIDKEEARFMELVSPMSKEELEEEVDMWGRKQSRAMHLFGLLRMASAYKMQLFLYMKQSGTSEIGTMNLWAGMDQPPAVK
jgi:hypothetical protein